MRNAYARTCRRSALLLALFLAAPGALAQSNSTFRKSKLGAPPASQPASATASVGQTLLPAPAPGIRAVQPDADAPPLPNQALLRSSLIAVQLPKQRKIKVNDLVTVIVREDKRSQSDAKLQEDKKWDVSSELSKWVRLNPQDHLIPQTFPNGTPGVGFNWDDKYGGQGKAERKDSLTTRITATVIDVKPNGTLVLEDTKTIKTDDDVQMLKLTGTCRSEDVTPENTVLSTQLAHASIETEHTGPSRDASRRGWLKRALDALRPF